MRDTSDIRYAQRAIVQAMEERGITRSEIARMLGFTRATITNALDDTRSPKPATLNAIAECVGLEVRVVVLEKEEAPGGG